MGKTQRKKYNPSTGKPKSRDTSNQEHRAMSSFVMYLLLLVGLIAEGLSISGIMSEQFEVHGFTMRVAQLSIVLMLIHQFMIIRNFHILDHLDHHAFSIHNIGNWIGRSRIEDFLRGVIFFCFSCLTGEVVYLTLVASKSSNLIADFLGIRQGQYYDLKWLTPFFVVCGTILSAIMLLWDILGYYYDKSQKPMDGIGWVNLKDLDPNLKIVYYPLNSPYYTFFFSDILGLCFWVLTTTALFFEVDEDLVTGSYCLLFLGYVIIIYLRLRGEFKIGWPKMVKALREYIDNTDW